MAALDAECQSYYNLDLWHFRHQWRKACDIVSPVLIFVRQWRKWRSLGKSLPAMTSLLLLIFCQHVKTWKETFFLKIISGCHPLTRTLLLLKCRGPSPLNQLASWLISWLIYCGLVGELWHGSWSIQTPLGASIPVVSHLWSGRTPRTGTAGLSNTCQDAQCRNSEITVNDQC